MKLANVKQRRDGKYSVTVIFPGGPNMFNGFYPDRVFNKIVSVEKLNELRATVARQIEQETKP
jgi:hypothetical protein